MLPAECAQLQSSRRNSRSAARVRAAALDKDEWRRLLRLQMPERPAFRNLQPLFVRLLFQFEQVGHSGDIHSMGAKDS